MVSLVRCGTAEGPVISSSDRRLLAMVAVPAWLALAACRGDTLAHGRTVHAEITGTRQFTSRLDVAGGEAVRLIVEQHRQDLVVTVTAPSGATRIVDLRERGQESVTLIGDTPGTFTLTIQRKAAQSTQTAANPPAAPAAPFEIRLEGVKHAVAERDRQMQKAEDRETAAKALVTGPKPQFAQALDALKESSALWSDLGDAMGQATTHARMGDIHYASAQFVQSEQHYLKARELFRPFNLPYQLAVIENNLGGGKERLGELASARAHFDAALGLWKTMLPDAEADMAVTQTNIGAMLVQYGDYQAAIEQFSIALPVLQRYPARMAVHGAAVFNNLGAAYQAVGDHDAAQRNFTQAMAALPPNSPRLAHLRLRLVQVALDRGDSQNAEASVRNAIDGIRGGPPNPALEADALNLLGQAQAATGQLEAALASHQEALALHETAQARRGIANALHHIGVVNRRLGRAPAARGALTRALALRQEVRLRDSEAETLYELGLLEEQFGSPVRARERFTAAIEIIEDVRGRVAAEYSRTAYFAARQKYFAALIDSLMWRRGGALPGDADAARAFDAAERERARALIDLLRESGTEIRRGVDPTLLEQERDEQRQLDFWANQLARLANQKGAEKLAAQALERMEAHLARYRELEGRIRASAAREPSAVASASVFTLADIQRGLLDPETRLLRITLGDRRSYAWFVTPNDVEIAVLPGRAVIERLARDVVDTVRTAPAAGNDRARRERFERDAAALSGMLLGKFAKVLGDHRLLIVCEGALQFVPFGALPKPGPVQPGPGARMIAHHEIAMIPSASSVLVLRQQLSGRPLAPKTLAVLADAVYEAEDPRVTRLQANSARAADDGAASEGGFDVGRLMQSKWEAAAVLGFVASPESRFSALGFAANRETMLGQVGGYRVVHVAAHAFPDSVRPEMSALVLSQYDDTGRRRRGVVWLHEISSRVDLQADVVVLSACSTAIGPDVPGEGLMGLARGFFGAGAASVIGSLNTVREEPTLELMKLLYEEMLGPRQRRPAAALRAAQVRMTEHARFGDPFYWSPFVFMGDPR